jgi:hypothetical protein
MLAKGRNIPLAGLAKTCHNPPLLIVRGGFIVFRHWFHSNCRLAWMAAAVIVLAAIAGCANWNPERFSINRLRDERAVDVDRRLDNAKPIVANPF